MWASSQAALNALGWPGTETAVSRYPNALASYGISIIPISRTTKDTAFHETKWKQIAYPVGYIEDTCSDKAKNAGRSEIEYAVSDAFNKEKSA
jgi:hypothetical protein